MSNYREKVNWGYFLWGFLHTITIIDFEDNKTYNEKIVGNLKELGKVIPCHKCSKHYNEYLQKIDDLDLRKPMVLFFWSVDLHNEINSKLHKPIYSYKDAIEQWCK